MMVDYCWTIMRDSISSEHKLRSKKTRFVPKPSEKSDVTPFSALTDLHFIVLWD